MSDKPRIFVIVRSEMGGDVIGAALAEDGHVLAGHWSSSRSFLRHDMGLTSDWKHAEYDKHYPTGWELVDLIDAGDLSAVPEYMAALEKNRTLHAEAPNV